jgi:PAS domain S-box-containing protein
VLYAEPDEAVAALTRQRLAYTAPNLHLEVVGTGADLLARLSGRSRHDLVLLESRLPDVSPLEVLKELRLGRRLDVPVILLLRPEDAELAVQATRLGASDYIIKSPGYLHELQVELESSFYRNELAREQHALRASEARFRELLEDLPAGVLLVGPGGDIRFCNQAASKIFGRPREEILRKLASDDDWVFVREDGTPLRLQDRRCRRPCRPAGRCTTRSCRCRRPDTQGQLWLLCNAVPCFGGDGQVEEVLLAFIDITEHTERKHAEEQLLRERAAAEAASGPRTSSSPCSPTSCATRSAPCATASRSRPCAATTGQQRSVPPPHGAAGAAPLAPGRRHPRCLAPDPRQDPPGAGAGRPRRRGRFAVESSRP